MTQEDKELLLRDLCARLPYGVRIAHKRYDVDATRYYLDNISKDNTVILTFSEREGCGSVSGREFMNFDTDKPYLRPMSSMTEKEINEYENFIANEKDDLIRFCNELVFYNAHHFDYRGLIPMGLALEAPEDMYKED